MAGSVAFSAHSSRVYAVAFRVYAVAIPSENWRDNAARTIYTHAILRRTKPVDGFIAARSRYVAGRICSAVRASYSVGMWPGHCDQAQKSRDVPGLLLLFGALMQRGALCCFFLRLVYQYQRGQFCALYVIR